MAFKLRTYIRVREYAEAPERCIEINEECTSIAIRDAHKRFPPVTFNFPKVFTDESQVQLLHYDARKKFTTQFAHRDSWQKRSKKRTLASYPTARAEPAKLSLFLVIKTKSLIC